MKKINNKSLRKTLLFFAWSLIFVFIGYFWGTHDVKTSWNNFSPDVSIVNKEAPVTNDVDFSLFWDVWKRLERDYIDKEKLDAQKMVWGAVKGMTQALGDPYTVFLPPEENDTSKEGLSGEFEGIGAQLGMKDKKVVVVAPLKGMPAEAAGIKAGDWILKVDDEDTIGWSVPEAVEKIRGQKGTMVVLTVLHSDQQKALENGEDGSVNIKPEEIEITRDMILVPSVETDYQGNVAILTLTRFGDTTNEEWEKAVSEIVARDSDKLILDLRNNPGGYLQGSVYISSEFLDGGNVVFQENSDKTREEFPVVRTGKLLKIPMVVLINEGSASASEIVSGALKVRGRAKLVGEKSFGKGTIQEAQDLPGGAGLHITTAKWLLPNGDWINGTGIEPDVEVADDLNTQKDEQLEKAIETINSM